MPHLLPDDLLDRIRCKLSTTDVENIVGFLGYGNPKESVWFIGIEEGLGGADSADAVENLKARGAFAPIMDLREAHHGKLREGGAPINFDVRPPRTQVWQWIAKIMRAYQGRNDWKDVNCANEYIRCSLGRYNGMTFLTELQSIPSNNTRNRAYTQAFNNLLGDKLDERLAKRQEGLLDLLDSSRPRTVICYGDGQMRARQYETFFDAEWTPIGARIARDSKRAYPFLLLPFFGNGQMKGSVIEELFKRGFLPGPGSRCQAERRE